MSKALFKAVEGKDKVKPKLDFIEREVVCCILRNPIDDTYLVLNWDKHEWCTFVIGGIEEGQNEISAGLAEIKEETGYSNVEFVKKIVEFEFQAFLQHKKINRHAKVRGLLFDLIDESKVAIEEEEKKRHSYKWLKKGEVKDSLNITSHKYFWSKYVGEDFEMNEGEVKNGDKYTII